MKIIYDDETQVALDELDKNIANRHQYLAVNFSFHWQDFHEDPILQQLQRIKSNLLATATVKSIKISDYPSDEKSFFEQLSVSISEAEKATGNFGKAIYNAGAAAEVTAEQIREAMAKLSLKKAPVFDELNKFHDEPIPVSLAVPRTQCHGKWRNDIEQFNIEESE